MKKEDTMFRHSRTKRTRGQALVEFTLAATLIFTLLSAAVDLGLIFFTMQTLRTAAQEGATFGSYPVVKLKSDGVSVQAVQLNELGIIERIRLSSGVNPTGFAKMTDLNNDGQNDSTQSSVFDEYITIENPKYPGDQLYDDDGNAVTPGTCSTTAVGADMRSAGKYCYIRVTVYYEYKFFFPLAPVFKNTIRLHATYTTHIRSSYIG